MADMSDADANSCAKSRTEEWEELWRSGIPIGELFDKAKPYPELVHQIADNTLPSGGAALVPGCGRGYEIEVLSRCERYDSVTGIDISQTCVQVATDFLTSITPTLPSNFHVQCVDFFDDAAELVGGKDGFSFVFDSSFLCALPVEMRPRWGERMKQIISHRGCLVTVMAPMDKSLDEGGPPFGVSIDLYRELLEPQFIAIDGPRRLDSHRAVERHGPVWWCCWQRA